MRVLALDIGERRTGIACGDSTSRIALPISTLDTAEILKNPSRLKAIADEHESELLLAGLPVSMDGEESRQAERVRALAETIAQALDLPLVFHDERLSSTEAKRYLREAGYTEREMRGKIDMLAATLILRAYLDSDRNEDVGLT